ncbi:MAG: transcriptional regulator [[Eubacterium] siraeum]|nr:transcriptional regulator [[Eubacterium] siraeum]
MLNLSKFAYRLNELMIEKGLNASELAENSGVERSAIYRYLAAEIAPSTENAVKLSNYFGYKIDFMLGLSDDDRMFDFKECAPFDERLKFLLKSKNKTQYALKKQTKISQSILHYWLKARYNPSLDNAVKLAKFFECSVDYVLGRIDYE